jgi:hypothetical protein
MYRLSREHAGIVNTANRAVRFLLLLGAVAVWAPGSASADVRHPSFPEALRGAWARAADQCGDDSTPRLIITDKRVTWPDGECALDNVIERAGPRGAIFSGRGSCVDRAKPPKRSAMNLIIEPRSDGTTWIGQSFEKLAKYQLCAKAP